MILRENRAGTDNKNVLNEIIGTPLASFLNGLRIPEYHSISDIDNKIHEWETLGAKVEVVGQSKLGSDIKLVQIGRGPRTILMWGYPHPDEPYGAEAIMALFDGLINESVSGLDDWTFAAVVCADPDEMSRQQWLKGERTLDSFLTGAWRPTHIGFEVDYGFPLQWGSFCYPPADFIGRCRTKRECSQKHGPGGCPDANDPYAPLPESLALGNAIRRTRPDIVASLHSTHTGGDYTFLLKKESRDVLDKLLAVPASVGTGRHLGEPIDRGTHWRKHTPDLIHERGLAWQQRWLEKQKDYREGTLYVMNHSAAQFAESIMPSAQFVCPETTQFRHPDFSDRTLIEDTIEAQLSVEDRKKGRYQMIRVRFQGEWKVASRFE